MVYPSYFATSDLQFGFKKQLSTTLCTGLIKKVVSKFVHAGSHVCGCFLDAMIAFDRVNHQADSERHFPLPLNRFLVSWYRSQKMQIRWIHCLPHFVLLMALARRVCFHLSFLQSTSITSSLAWDRLPLR